MLWSTADSLQLTHAVHNLGTGDWDAVEAALRPLVRAPLAAVLAPLACKTQFQHLTAGMADLDFKAQCRTLFEQLSLKLAGELIKKLRRCEKDHRLVTEEIGVLLAASASRNGTSTPTAATALPPVAAPVQVPVASPVPVTAPVPVPVPAPAPALAPAGKAVAEVKPIGGMTDAQLDDEVDSKLSTDSSQQTVPKSDTDTALSSEQWPTAISRQHLESSDLAATPKPFRTSLESESADIDSTTEFSDGPDRKRMRLDERYRTWKRTAMLIWNRIADHRAGNAFLKSVKDKQYAECIRRPMSLDLVKARIREGTTRTTAEFHRDVLHVLANAVMFNPEESELYEMALEMKDYVDSEMRNLLVYTSPSAINRDDH